MKNICYLTIIGLLFATQSHAQQTIKPIAPEERNITNKYLKCLADQMEVLEPSEASFDDIFPAAIWWCQNEKSIAWGELTRWLKSQPNQEIQASASASQILDNLEKYASSSLRYHMLKNRALRKKTVSAPNK
ncbi:MAG: hypothetical protein KA312_08160 [Sphingorhabdus sp.]|nr:hypothetical protein [Sphingorhabdus sp.]